MENQALYEYIEQYLSDQLSEEEALSFEQRMLDDPGFSKEVSLVRSLHQIVISGQEQRVLHQLNQIQAELEQQSIPKVSSFPWKRLALVASILLLLVLGWVLRNQFFPIDQEELFASHFDAYRAPVVLRGEETLNQWEEVRDAYVEERFEEVIQLLEGDSTISPSYLRAFYLGQAYLANNPPNPANAIQQFQLVLAGDNDYQAQAYWYLALAYLQLGELDQAKTTLDILIQDFRYQQEEARQLRERL